VLVNDGSSDGTLEVLEAEFDLVEIHAAPLRRPARGAPGAGDLPLRRTPSLVVVDKENGGKADALNVGLDVAGGELVCAIDSDTLVEADALQRMIRPFLCRRGRGGRRHDPRRQRLRGARGPRGQGAPAAAAAARAAGGRVPARVPAGRLGWNRLGGNLVISGAFGSSGASR
jgi:glycosyltransferase involved in cell wall biosynthesis